MKNLLALALLVAPSSAFAGFGTTAHLTAASDGTSWVPSFDWRTQGIVVQAHLLDTLASTVAGGDFALDVGVDVTYAVVKKKIGEDTEGILAPGGAIRVANYGDFGFNALAEMRMGAEMKKGMGFGIYVVPQLGVTTLPGEFRLAYGGGFQISAWLAD